jgi:hypothetical protein
MRKLLAAAAVAGVAATTASRSKATDAGVDAGADASADASDDASTDATDEADAQDADAADAFVYDVSPGHDPAPPPPDANMNIGYDPVGGNPSTTGENSGCGCTVVGRKAR